MEAATAPPASGEKISKATDSKQTPPEQSPTKEKKISTYVVLRSDNDTGPFEPIGDYDVVGNGGQRAARVAALRDQGTGLQKDIEEGKSVFLTAVPVASFQPFEAMMEQREPRLVV